MLNRSPKPQWFKLLKKAAVIGIVAEGLAFAGSYLFWYRLNTNRDFRFYCHNNHPWVLEGYYKVGEYFDSAQSIKYIRQQDLAAWSTANRGPDNKE